MPASSVEPLQAVRYTSGQEYRPHTDDPFRAPPRKRLITIFTYLSDEGLASGRCGGATRFTRLHSGGQPLRVFPQKGRAVTWANYTPEGRLDTRTEHAGEPVTCAGATKWGLNAWLLGEATPPRGARARSARAGVRTEKRGLQ